MQQSRAGTNSFDHIDLPMVIKGSQTPSDEIGLQNLIEALLRVAMVQAGAERMGIFSWDGDGVITGANEVFLQMLQYSQEDFASGRVRWTDLSLAEEHERDQRVLKAFRMVRPCEQVLLRKDGGHVAALIERAPFEEDGNRGVAFVLDLTERKRAEQTLRESQAKFSDFAETTSDWLWEVGPDFKFTMLTENAFGSDPSNRIGTACWDHALDLETEPEKWRLIRANLEAHKPFRDFVYCTKGGHGSPLCVKVNGKPVFDANGDFRGYRGTGTDVTALVRAQRAEESLRTLQGELARMSRLTTLGQLTASLTHEVAQPIGAARNDARAALNLLHQNPPDLTAIGEMLECVVGDADRAGNIIDRIRDQMKNAPPRKAHFDLNETICEVLDLARSAISENAVSVQTCLAENLFPIHGDRVQLQQVVLNLILNAVEAMGSLEMGSERRLSISTRQLQASGVLVTVRDSGPGIDPVLLEQVFEAFYTTKSGGVGMGLSICRSIIDAHRGRLWAEANDPRGAVFQFTLPRHEAQELS